MAQSQELNKEQAELLLNRVRTAKRSLVDFRKNLLINDFQEKPSPQYHYDWSNILLNSTDNFAIEGFRESGKALCVDTEIPTPNGFKKMGDIKINDVVFDGNGKECNVLFATDVMYDHQCYKITFRDNTSIIADGEHLWNVYDKKRRKSRTVKTSEMAEEVKTAWRKFEYRYQILNCGPVSYQHKELAIHPYLLGLWLGDGTSNGTDITVGNEDYENISGVINKLWGKTSLYAYKDRAKRINLLGGFKKLLLKYNLCGNKHIPMQYQISSRAQRIGLLCGLMDSDGTIAKSGTKAGVCSFDNTNKQLAEDVKTLIHSLGIKTTMRSKVAKIGGVEYSIVYTVEFKTAMKVFGLERKARYQKRVSRNSSFRSVIKIEKVSSVPVKCIQVDSKDSLYLITNSFIPTHNTQIILRAFPLYCLMFPHRSREYIVFLCNNTDTARKKLKEIEQEYHENDIIRQREIKIIEESADVFCLKILDSAGKPRTIRIEAFGKGKSIRGLAYREKRPDIVIADDLQDESDASSQTILVDDWTWFQSEVSFLGRYTRFFMIANNLGERCIIEQIFSCPENFNFKTQRVAIEDDAGKPVWSEMFSGDYIAAEKKRYTASGDLAIWMRNRMCVAVSAETQVFKKDDLRWYHPNEKMEIMSRCRIFGSGDFAGSLSKTADYTAYVIIGVDEEDYWYVLDVWYGRWDGPQQIEKLFELVREYKPDRFGIETTGAHGAVMKSTIDKEMSTRHCMFSMLPITPDRKHSKEERIEIALGTRVRLNKLLLPEKASWLDEMITELTMFTREGAKSRHDDLLDALAQFYKFAKAPMTRSGGTKKNVKNLPRSSISNVYVR